MAEGLAAAGVAASIVQLVDFSIKVIRRIEQFHTNVGEVPKSFRHIKTELPVLTTALQQLGEAVDANSVDDSIKNALKPVISGCQEQIRQLDTILAKILPNPSDSRWGKNKKAIVSLRQDDKVESITRILRDYITTLTFYHSAASSNLRPRTDETLEKIRRWLAAPDPSINYQKALKQRQADTGLWFLRGDQYAAWKTDTASFLWLHGIPGCGKTILSSTILQDVLQHCGNDPGKVVAYFYFDFNDAQKQSPELMLRSIICQLSQQCVEIPASLDNLFSYNDGQRQPSLHALEEVLQKMIKEFPHVYIALDALDECGEREELLDIIETIAAWQLPNLHVLLTSRKERDIETSLETFIDHQSFINLVSSLVDSDIQKYVRQRLSDDKSLNKWKKDATISQEIETALMEGAHGMFRWAACQLDTLGKCRNRAMLRKSLAELPPTLDKTYDRILRAISKEDSHYAIRILQWLTFSIVPLSVDEVAEIAAIDVKRNPPFDREEVLEDPLEALSICSSLITMTTKHYWSGSTKEMLALAHYSVKEYLVSDRICKGPAAHYNMQDTTCHETIATGCLQYLQFQGSGLLSEDTAKEFKLSEYSAKFWPNHAMKIKGDQKGFCQAALDLFSNSDSYLNWLRIYDPDPLGRSDFEKSLESISTPLYYMSLLGLEVVVKLLLDTNVDVNMQAGYFGNALQAASCRGHEQIVKLLLLDKNIDINAQGGHFGNALQGASVFGHEQIVKLLLLDKNVDVNAQGGEYGNALQAASARGHEQIVKLLLGRNVDVNAQGGKYSNALQAASFGGYKQIVKLLLDKNVDVNAQGGEYGNALQAASSEGHEQVVKLLLDKNVDVNAQGGEYGNALQAALYRGYEQIVKLLLLDKSVDVNAQGGPYGNALQVASYRGHEQIVKLLLDKNVDVNAQGGYYGNSLQAASRGGHEQIVKLLLDKNVDVNVQDGAYGNALQAASLKGQEQIVKLLLNKNVDVDAQGGAYSNALQAASCGGYEQIVKLLLDRNVDVNAQGGIYGNALQAASARGHEQIVKLLLNKNVDVNVQGGEYGNALQAASARGHGRIVKLLLDKNINVDVNAQGGPYGNALQAASIGSHEQIIKLLLNHGAVKEQDTKSEESPNPFGDVSEGEDGEVLDEEG